MDKVQLEQKALYRFIRVLYYFTLILCVLFFAMLSWTFRSLAGFTLGLIVSFVILNLIREALIYIFFGKSFDFKWLTSSKSWLSNIFEPI